MTKNSKTALVIMGIFSTVALVAWGQSPPAAAPAFKPVQSLGMLMGGQDKLMGRIKDAILDKAWEDAESSAWLLAEIANVNQYQKDDPDYRALASRMSGECVELAKVLKKRDAKAAKDHVQLIGQTCKSCHEKFEKKK